MVSLRRPLKSFPEVSEPILIFSEKNIELAWESFEIPYLLTTV
ncbi:hypothetical protein COLO4_08063 [Corchorus olitorius]|uniref:Uncharacterized protein n=1 Tax=Corchorus olitorius TaxID=93759 RepID=A0A1R3KHJ7_9ROSI|nr:hypothetical protein COLO4_08063 [Corchorus olitorius]